MCKTISDGRYSTYYFRCNFFPSIFRFSLLKYLGKPCVLPWKNGNETNWYYGCAEPAANRPWKDEKWCPTEVDGNKRFNPWTNYNWNKNWGYCENICLDTSSKYLTQKFQIYYLGSKEDSISTFRMDNCHNLGKCFRNKQ